MKGNKMKLPKRKLRRIIKEAMEEFSDQDAVDKINELFRSTTTEEIVTAIQMAWMMGLNPEDLEIYPLLPRDIAEGNDNSARIVDAFFDAGPTWEAYIRNKAYDEVGSSKADARHFVPKYPNDPTKTSGSYEFREFDFLKTPADKLTVEMKKEIFSQAFLTPLSKDTSWMSKVKNERKNTMKITKRQLKRIILEEYNRPLPITWYSDEMLLEEGLMDFIGGLFGAFNKFFGNAGNEAEKDFKGKWSKTESDVQSTAAKILGKEEAKEIKSFDDLDMKKKPHQKIYFTALVGVAVETIKECIALLNNAAGIKDWTPADDTEEAAKKWQSENGETSLDLFTATGNVGGSLRFFAEMGMQSAAAAYSAYREKISTGNPAQAVEVIISSVKLLSDIWNVADQVGAENAGQVSDGWDQVGAAAQKVGQAIAASGKEQQNETLQLRKTINELVKLGLK
jgi:hypothetical protein